MEVKRVFGIDLGTTYSCIAYIDEHGKPVVVSNTEGALTTPSVVYFESESSHIVGQTAKDVAKLYPALVVQTVKRHMGDATWVRNFYGVDYTPQEISALILKKVVRDAEQVLGQKIEDVVITCPAYFGNVEKDATRQAGILAGLNVRHVVTEPMAAAFAYGTESDENSTILVYDLGGGTFDVTVLKMPGSALATDGDHNLGGKDWDDDLIAFFGENFQIATGSSSNELLADSQTWQELAIDAEKCKIALSAPSRSSYKLRIKSGLENVPIEVTRDDFERITRHRLDRTIMLTRQVLARASEQGAAVNKVLLVGGSTFMPQVDARLKEEFPSYKLLRSDPNLIVAKGAALIGLKYQLDAEIQHLTTTTNNQKEAQEAVALAHGMSLRGIKQMNEAVLRDVLSKSFGLEVVNAAKEDVVSNLLILDTPIPAAITRTFSTHEDQQTGVLIKIMENLHRGNEEEVPPDDCKEIGRAELTFDHPLPQRSPVEVSFAISSDGILKVDARDLTTQRTVQAEFISNALLSKEKMEQSSRRIGALQIT
jgi:molecular chaperone DnaK (HSP70)